MGKEERGSPAGAPVIAHRGPDRIITGVFHFLVCTSELHTLASVHNGDMLCSQTLVGSVILPASPETVYDSQPHFLLGGHTRGQPLHHLASQPQQRTPIPFESGPATALTPLPGVHPATAHPPAAAIVSRSTRTPFQRAHPASGRRGGGRGSAPVPPSRPPDASPPRTALSHRPDRPLHRPLWLSSNFTIRTLFRVPTRYAGGFIGGEAEPQAVRRWRSNVPQPQSPPLAPRITSTSRQGSQGGGGVRAAPPTPTPYPGGRAGGSGPLAEDTVGAFRGGVICGGRRGSGETDRRKVVRSLVLAVLGWFPRAFFWETGAGGAVPFRRVSFRRCRHIMRSTCGGKSVTGLAGDISEDGGPHACH